MITTPLSPSQTQSERLQALYNMAVELSVLLSLESVLNTALQHCLDLTESQFGFVGLNTPNGRALDVVAMQGFFPKPDFYERNHIIPLRPSIFARAVLENRPVCTEDARYDPSRFGQPQGHPPVAAFLGVPLRTRPQPYDENHEAGAMLELRSAQKRLANGRIQQTGESLEAVSGILHRVEAELLLC